MPKPINQTIGKCVCSEKGCDEVAEVRKMRGASGKLYLVCPDCGTIRHGGRKLQEHILNNANMHGPEQPAPKPEPEPAPEKPQAPERAEKTPPLAPAPKKRQGGVMAWLNDFDW